MPLGMVKSKIKSGEGQYSPPLSPTNRMVILPHGIVVVGAGQKAPGAFDLNLAIDGDGRHAVTTYTVLSKGKARSRAGGAFVPLLLSA